MTRETPATNKLTKTIITTFLIRFDLSTDNGVGFTELNIGIGERFVFILDPF